MKLLKRYWPTLIAAVAMTISGIMVLSVNEATEDPIAITTDQHYKERCLWKLIELENQKINVTVPPMECSALTTQEKAELTGAIGTYIKNIVLP